MYDVQFQNGERTPIPQDTINDIADQFNKFKAVCSGFEIPAEKIQVLATETTRTASNSVEFLGQIREKTGIVVEPSSKSTEALLGL